MSKNSDFARIVGKLLRSLDYDLPKINSNNKAMQAALSDFQKRHQLKVTGTATPETFALLKDPPPPPTEDRRRPAEYSAAPNLPFSNDMDAPNVEQPVANPLHAVVDQQSIDRRVNAGTHTLEEATALVQRHRAGLDKSNAKKAALEAKGFGLDEDLDARVAQALAAGDITHPLPDPEPTAAAEAALRDFDLRTKRDKLRRDLPVADVDVAALDQNVAPVPPVLQPPAIPQQGGATPEMGKKFPTPAIPQQGGPIPEMGKTFPSQEAAIASLTPSEMANPLDLLSKDANTIASMEGPLDLLSQDANTTAELGKENPWGLLSQDANTIASMEGPQAAAAAIQSGVNAVKGAVPSQPPAPPDGMANPLDLLSQDANTIASMEGPQAAWEAIQSGVKTVTEPNTDFGVFGPRELHPNIRAFADGVAGFFRGISPEDQADEKKRAIDVIAGNLNLNLGDEAAAKQSAKESQKASRAIADRFDQAFQSFE